MDLDDNAQRDRALRWRKGPIQHLNASELLAALTWVNCRAGQAGSGLPRIPRLPEADPDLLWQVCQQLAGGRRVQASAPIRFQIIQKNQEWLIAGIDY